MLSVHWPFVQHDADEARYREEDRHTENQRPYGKFPSSEAIPPAPAGPLVSRHAGVDQETGTCGSGGI
jgi:hypothetical protein